MADTLYDTDFVAWTERQADEMRRVARERANLPLDWENIAEEIESSGKRDRRDAESCIRLIMVHLIRLLLSPAREPRSGSDSEVEAFRFKLDRVLRDSPSLRGKLQGELESIAGKAAREVGRSFEQQGEHVDAKLILLRLRSFTLDDILDESFLPSPEAEG